MIVVDSSVWISRLRGLRTAPASRLREMVEDRDDEILVGDLVLLEVLQGARDDAHAARIEHAMRAFPMAPMLDETVAVAAAANYRALRAMGITVRKPADMIIGTFCIQRGHRLLHEDRAFDPMARHLGLRVA